MQAAALAAFFYGYVAAHFPAAILTERLGGKWIVGATAAGDGLISLLTPTVLTELGFGALLAARALQGILQCFPYPGIALLWLKQSASATEHRRLDLLETVSTNTGVALSLVATGLLSVYGFSGGWPSAFYLHGSFSMAFALLWMLLIWENPRPQAAEPESFPCQDVVSPDSAQLCPTKIRQVPWLQLMSSRPVWAVLIADLCDSWCFYVFLLSAPAFINDKLTSNIPEVGAVTASTFAAQLAFAVLAFKVAGKLMSRHTAKTVIIRKAATCTGFLLAAGCLVGLSLVKCSPGASIALLILVQCCSGMATAGYRMNHVDIAPRYPGAFIALLRTVSAVTASAVPHVVSQIVDVGTRVAPSPWHVVFFVTAGIYVMGALLYTIMAAGEVQPWATDPAFLSPEIVHLCHPAEVTVTATNAGSNTGALALKPLLPESETAA